MSVTLLLTTIAAQVGSAYFNSKRSKAQSAELAEKQQRLEERIMLQGIENSREEYAQVCALQREIEQLMQKDRLDLIQQNYLSSIELDAYNVSLEHWPLFTPPYVIKGQFINALSGVSSTDVIPINCIMTTSMHTKFNQKIFPQLEERLALFCSKHWNSSQPNSIRFYQNAWRDNIVDLGARIIDLYAHLDDVPTIALSPVVRNGKITFRIYWWGISGNPKDQHINDAMVYDPELSIVITDDLSLSEADIKHIIDDLSNKLSALISYFADQYYFYMYNIAPKLLVNHKVVANNNSCISEIDEIRSWFRAVYDKRLGQYVQRKMQDIKDCIKYQLFEWNDLPSLIDLKNRILERKDNALQAELNVIIEAISGLLQLKSSTDKCLEHYTYLTLYQLFQNVKNLYQSNNIIYFEFDHKKRIVSVYATSSLILIDGIKYFERYNYGFDCLLVPLDLSQKRIKRIKIERNNIDSFIVSIADNCSYNLFYKTLTLNDIISYCNSLNFQVEKCELIKGEELNSVMTDIGDWEQQHLLHCNIKQGHCTTDKVFYYDCLSNELKQMFEDANHLIIE